MSLNRPGSAAGLLATRRRKPVSGAHRIGPVVVAVLDRIKMTTARGLGAPS